MKSTKTSVRPKSLFSNPKYFGKHVLITKGSVYAVKSATQASRLFDQITKKTGTPPTVTFIPKAQSLITEFSRKAQSHPTPFLYHL